MVKRVLVTLVGLIFISGGIAGILFVTALTGLAATPSTGGYLMMAVLGVGLFGPLVILGLHCVWFRRVVGLRGDRFAIAACALCGLAGAAAIIGVSALGSSNSSVAGGYFLLFFLSAAFCSIGIKVGRF